jgi:hypothetical protein
MLVLGSFLVFSTKSFALTTQESRDAFEIFREMSVTSKIAADEKRILEEKIAQTLEKLNSIKTKKGKFLFPKEALKNELRQSKTFQDAIKSLEKIQQEAPATIVNVGKVESNLQEQKSNTAIYSKAQQVKQDTDRIMNEAFISTNKDFNQSEKDTIKQKIHAIVEGYYNKTIPNLTGQSPIENLIVLFKLPKNYEDIESRISKFNQDIKNFSDKYVNRKDNLNKEGNTIASEIILEDYLIVSLAINIDKLIKDFSANSKIAVNILKLDANPQQAEDLRQLISSKSSGFIDLPLSATSSNRIVIMKLLSFKNVPDKTGRLLNVVAPTYIKFTVGSNNIDKLANMKNKEYEFWFLQSNLFAIPKTPQSNAPILSLSKNKSNFTGQIINEISKARSIIQNMPPSA